VRGTGRNDCNASGARLARYVSDGDFEVALDDVPDLLLRMFVPFDRCAGIEFIMAERHARRVEVTPVPTGFALDDGQLVRIDEVHGHPSTIVTGA
jgi:hypothetical protein